MILAGWKPQRQTALCMGMEEAEWHVSFALLVLIVKEDRSGLEKVIIELLKGLAGKKNTQGDGRKCEKQLKITPA